MTDPEQDIRRPTPLDIERQQAEGSRIGGIMPEPEPQPQLPQDVVIGGTPHEVPGAGQPAPFEK